MLSNDSFGQLGTTSTGWRDVCPEKMKGTGQKATTADPWRFGSNMKDTQRQDWEHLKSEKTTVAA